MTIDMCSIYGSKNRTLFNILHDATRERGVYAFSAAFLDHESRKLKLHRQCGHPKDIEKLEPISNASMFLGHNQAPTSSARDYDKATSHPFVVGNWVVAHNGVLTNHVELNKKHCVWNKNPVDTSVIPNLLHVFEQKKPDASEEEIICNTLSLLEGTFALWIFNDKTGNVFVARQGSTLFANPTTGDFCSIESKGWIEVPEGKLHRVTHGFEPVGEFKSTSPFFTL